jgi:hypothetical protein
VQSFSDIEIPAPLPRFTIRRGTIGLMVWDREAKGPARIDGRFATGLTPEQAAQIEAALRFYYAEGPPPQTNMRDAGRPATVDHPCPDAPTRKA